MNLGRLWCNFVFLDVHDVFDSEFDLFFQQQTETNFFCQTAFAFFLEAACRFTTTSWTRRMFVEFVRSLRCL